MSLLLIIFSSDENLREFSAKNKSRVFPASSISKSIFYNIDISVISFDVDKFSSNEKIEAAILDKSKNSSHVIVMIDKDKVHLASNINYSAMVIGIESYIEKGKHQNYLHYKLSKALKTFNYLNTMFSRFSDSVLLSLPLNNFSGDDLISIKNQFSSQDHISDIQSDFDKQMKVLRSRVRPKRSTKRPDKYAVDDKNRFFVFGKEEHSRPDTGGEHAPYCEFNSLFRFGFSISNKRHYNVSEGEKDLTTISGKFSDCHGTVRTVNTGTHLNMFSNDFF